MVVMQGCADYWDYVVSTCCPYEEFCEASEMRTLLACECGGPERCFGEAYEAWGCAPAVDMQYLECSLFDE